MDTSIDITRALKVSISLRGQISNLLTLVSAQHENILRIENTGSTSWKPLRFSSGLARDDDVITSKLIPIPPHPIRASIVPHLCSSRPCPGETEKRDGCTSARGGGVGEDSRRWICLRARSSRRLRRINLDATRHPLVIRPTNPTTEQRPRGTARNTSAQRPINE